MRYRSLRCKVLGCTNLTSNKLGLCRKHLIRLIRRGTVEDRACLVKGCPRPHSAAGYCQFHYNRWKRFGDPLRESVIADAGVPMKFLLEFLKRADFGGACIQWPFGAVPQISRKREGRPPLKVCRFVCQRFHGKPPTREHQAAHSCGRGHEGCINPNHLYWATPKQNAWDKLKHGTLLRGSKCPWAKLTEDQVREIRNLKGQKPYKVIAARYGVNEETVGDILRGTTWAWLD